MAHFMINVTYLKESWLKNSFNAKVYLMMLFNWFLGLKETFL